MLVIEIAGDALVKNGEFVILSRVPLAIAQANGAENMLDAERKLFSRINAGVQQGTLNPLHPETNFHLAARVEFYIDKFQLL